MTRCALLALALAACSSAYGDAPSLERPDVVRERMRRQFNDLRDIQEMLLNGKLEDAKARSFLVTRQSNDAGLGGLAAQAQAVTDAATSLGEARDVPEGCRRLAKVVGACAECHVHFPKPLRAPPETEPQDAQVPSRMQVHMRASDRLFEGAVLGDLRRWREGVDALALAPIPTPGRDALATKLQERAMGAQAEINSGSSTAASRAAAYGEMLVTCAECHARQVVSSR